MNKFITFPILLFMTVFFSLVYYLYNDGKTLTTGKTVVRDASGIAGSLQANRLERENQEYDLPLYVDYVVITVTPTNTPIPTPTLKPTMTPRVTQAELHNVTDINKIFEFINKYSREYSVSEDLLKKIAKCESGFNPLALNGPYGGMFQFSKASWQSARHEMSLNDDANLRFSAEEAIRTAAYKLSKNAKHIWPNCSK